MVRGPLTFLSAIDAAGASLSSDWWVEINESTQWQDAIFFALCAAYALVSAVALIQLIRIEVRVPEYGWTTQKVFHLMNFIVNGVRAIVFGFHIQVFNLHPKVLLWGVLDLPGLLFFSTYTLLVLFWAEIYHQARSLPTDKLRIVFITVNGVVYAIQACIWAYIWVNDNNTVEFIEKMFIAVVSFTAALGFLIYGGRLFFMLRRFPIESKGRRKKLHEVGYVTGICFFCFLIRCTVVGAWRDRIIVCTGTYGPTQALIKAFLDSGAKAVICPSAEPQEMQLTTFNESNEFSGLENGRFEIGEDEVEDEEAEPASPISDWEDSEPEKVRERSMFFWEDDEEEISEFVCKLYESLFKGGARVDVALKHALTSHRSLRYTCHLPTIP